MQENVCPTMFGLLDVCSLLVQNQCGAMDSLPINDTFICNDQEIYILLMLDLTIMHGVPMKSRKELVFLFMVCTQYQLLLTGIIR